MNDEIKNPVGRPKTPCNLSDNDLKCITSLYQQGASDAEVKSFIYDIRGSFSEDLWSRWLKEEPVFAEHVKIGRMLSQAWWEKSGRLSLLNKDFSYTGWYMNMKNRFGWKDKIESENNTNVQAEVTHRAPDLPASAEWLARIITGGAETSS